MNLVSDKNIPLIYRKFMFNTLGLNEDHTIIFWALVILASLTFWSLWFFDGNVVFVLGLLYILGFFLLSLFRIDFSFYIVIFAVMVFDQYEIPGFTTLTHKVGFFYNLKEISYLPYFDAGVLNLFEIHLLILLFSFFIRLAVMKDFAFKRVPALIPFLIFVGAFLFSCVYGLRQGGDFLVILWEVRALFYLILLYLFVPQIIQSAEQIKWLIWFVIFGVSVKAFQAIWKFIALGITTGGYPTLTNHEDPVFIVTLLILLLGFLVYKSWNKQTVLLLLLLIPYLLAFYVGQRRATYASLMVSFSTFIILLPGIVRWKFMKLMFPMLVVFVIYSAIFWNSNSFLARPVQTIKSGIVKPDIQENVDDYYSNLYRENENYNLAATVRNHPVFGIGFGNKYDQPIPLVAIPYPLRDYIPHNEIFWLIVKMGTVGFFAFWFFFNSVAAKGVQVFSRLKDPYLKSVTLFVIIAIINQMVVSYFDLQLTYYRNMVYLGCLLGLLPALQEAANNELPQKETASNKQGRKQEGGKNEF